MDQGMGTTLDVHLFDTPEFPRRVTSAERRTDPHGCGRPNQLQSGSPYRKASDTSKSSHTARQITFGSSPAASASSAVRPASAEKTWSRATDGARSGPNCACIRPRNSVCRTPTTLPTATDHSGRPTTLGRPPARPGRQLPEHRDTASLRAATGCVPGSGVGGAEPAPHAPSRSPRDDTPVGGPLPGQNQRSPTTAPPRQRPLRPTSHATPGVSGRQTPASRLSRTTPPSSRPKQPHTEPEPTTCSTG